MRSEVRERAASAVRNNASPVALDPAQVSDTLGVLLKYQDDIARMQGTKAAELVEQAKAEASIAGPA